jgi:hypothetical protein
MPHDWLRLLVGGVIALAFMGMTMYVVSRVSRAAPNRIAITLTAVTGLCGALPAILYALH